MPAERKSLTHKFCVGGHEGYITVGLYEDGTLGEIFVAMAKEGSTVSGLADSFAIAISLALQYGVPLSVLTEKFSHTRFEPSGWTGNPEVPYAKSVVDYIFRWLALRFQVEAAAQESAETPTIATDLQGKFDYLPICLECGATMEDLTKEYRCRSCGALSPKPRAQ